MLHPTALLITISQNSGTRSEIKEFDMNITRGIKAGAVLGFFLITADGYVLPAGKKAVVVAPGQFEEIERLSREDLALIDADLKLAPELMVRVEALEKRLFSIEGTIHILNKAMTQVNDIFKRHDRAIKASNNQPNAGVHHGVHHAQGNAVKVVVKGQSTRPGLMSNILQQSLGQILVSLAPLGISAAALWHSIQTASTTAFLLEKVAYAEQTIAYLQAAMPATGAIKGSVVVAEAAIFPTKVVIAAAFLLVYLYKSGTLNYVIAALIESTTEPVVVKN
jgi:hypothetical protein